MGVKGFIYGERGVWRPGDELYLSLILEDKLKVLPDGHPIVAQLMDPNGHIVQTRTGETGNNNIHCFTFKTAEDAQTGYWHALFKIGGLTFSKTLRIEAIKPNRLAINLEFPNEQIIGTGVSNAPVEVHTRWLNGAPTSHLKADARYGCRPTKAVSPHFRTTLSTTAPKTSKPPRFLCLKAIPTEKAVFPSIWINQAQQCPGTSECFFHHPSIRKRR